MEDEVKDAVLTMTLNKMSTSRERNLQELRQIWDVYRNFPLNKMREDLCVQQNEPPLGGADGSMSEAAWTKLRDALEKMNQAKRAVLAAGLELAKPYPTPAPEDMTF